MNADAQDNTDAFRIECSRCTSLPFYPGAAKTHFSVWLIAHVRLRLPVPALTKSACMNRGCTFLWGISLSSVRHQWHNFIVVKLLIFIQLCEICQSYCRAHLANVPVFLEQRSLIQTGVCCGVEGLQTFEVSGYDSRYGI